MIVSPGETEELQVGDTVVIQLSKDTLKSLDIAKISVARETQEVRHQSTFATLDPGGVNEVPGRNSFLEMLKHRNGSHAKAGVIISKVLWKCIETL